MTRKTEKIKMKKMKKKIKKIKKMKKIKSKKKKKAKGRSSLPGGGQVDGLPPALSTDPSLKDTRVKTDLFRNFRKFFSKS